MSAFDAVYRGMKQTELDWAYNNRDRVPDHPELLSDYARIGDEYLTSHTAHLDIAFGPTAPEILDVYPALNSDVPSPVMIYFHGGYWFSRHKDDFRFVASGFTDADITVVVVNYALIPSVDMAELVRQCQASVAWTYLNIAGYGGDPNKLYATGHSAGGHITAMMFATDWSSFEVPSSAIKGGVAISGLYDLEPIRLSFMNETLQFDEETVLRFSPLKLSPIVKTPLICAVGGDESDEFLRHNEMLVEPWRDRGINVETMVQPGLNHFSILGNFATAGGQLNARTRALMGVNE